MMQWRLSLINLPSSTSAPPHSRRYTQVRPSRFALMMEASTSQSTRVRCVLFAVYVRLARMAVG